MIKKYDIVATVGSYTKNGVTKKKYKNVGVVMENDKGPFILLDRSFNPAGVSSEGENIILSLFAPKVSEDQKDGVGAELTFNDEIPF